MQQADQPGESTQPSLADKTKNPKRIFFSYGHDGNRELVDRFKVDLEKRGHTVWIDYKDIGAWDDWKSRITQGIHDSQMAIAFLSMHSTRDPGVCRNEMAMALNHFGTLYPILLEKLPMGSIPLTITHLQWPDLSSWRALKDGPDPAEFERFYQEKLLEIVSRIEGEETRFASEADALRRVLLPSDFDGKFAQHLDGFIGREWVCEEFEKWRDEQPKSRVFWLKAGLGFGKTALAVQLASKYRATIVGTWFCDSQSMQSRDPVQAVRTLAFQLAIRWDDYRTRLLAKLGIYENSQPEQIREAWTTLAKKNLVDTFRHLLVEPMSGLIWREHKLVVMLDGLDEATQDDGKNLLASLISKQFLELPPWICFVVTSRPEASVVGHLQRFNPFEIQAHDKRNMADLERYAQAHITTQPQLLALKPAARKALCDQLLLKAEGMILYLHSVAEGLQEGIINVDGLATMQAGLGGLHSQYFQTFEHRFGEGFQENVQPLLRLLLAAPSVLPVELAGEVLQWNKERLMRARLGLKSYLVETPAGMGLFHKTLGEWLQSEASGMFFTDASEVFLSLEKWCKRVGETEDALNFLAQTYEKHGDLNISQKSHEASLKKRRILARKFSTINNRLGLASALEWIADYKPNELMQLKVLREALAKRAEIYIELNTIGSALDVARLMDQIGWVEYGLGYKKEARRRLQDCIEINRVIVGQLQNRESKASLAESICSLGLVEERENLPVLYLYLESLEIYRLLFLEFSSDYKKDYAWNLCKVSKLELASGNTSGALAKALESIDLLKNWIEENKDASYADEKASFICASNLRVVRLAIIQAVEVVGRCYLKEGLLEKAHERISLEIQIAAEFECIQSTEYEITSLILFWKCLSEIENALGNVQMSQQALQKAQLLLVQIKK